MPPYVLKPLHGAWCYPAEFPFAVVLFGATPFCGFCRYRPEWYQVRAIASRASLFSSGWISPVSVSSTQQLGTIP